MQLEQSPPLPAGPPAGQFAHGFDGHAAAPDLPPPTMVVECAVEARPNMSGSCHAHEFHDTPEALRAKVKILAEMLRTASHSVAYTGAGISTAAGISDYASKAGARSTVLPKQPSGGTPFAPGASINSEPTYAHRALVALHGVGLLAGGWVQQNHDALAQKAGFPQEYLNEIHGSWFDPSNPVVPMEASLRPDLVRRLKQSSESADLVLVMGTSLSGVAADRIVSSVGHRRLAAKAEEDRIAEAGEKAGTGETASQATTASTASPPLGTCIVNIQQTRLDHVAALRIFATCDEVMRLLTTELGLQLPSLPVAPTRVGCASAKRMTATDAKTKASAAPKWMEGAGDGVGKDSDVWQGLPYDATTGERYSSGTATHGRSSSGGGTTLDLRCGKRVRLAQGNAPMAPSGLEGVVASEKTAQGHYRIEFVKESGEVLLCHLGKWMLEAAADGRLDMLPVVPCTACDA